LDFSPTGTTLVTGSYDKTIRLFDLSGHVHAHGSGHSRDVYHTKRMQKVWTVKVAMDASTLFSGSEDGQIRLWRAQASERPGYKNARQESALHHNKALAIKFAALPEISRIATNRHVPKPIVVAQKENRIMRESAKRKRENRRRHSRPGAVPYTSERVTPIVAVKK
jgi:WD40 repeat protein